MPKASLGGHIVQRHIETRVPVELARFQSLLIPITKACLTISIEDQIKLLVLGRSEPHKVSRRRLLGVRSTGHLACLRIFSGTGHNPEHLNEFDLVAGIDITQHQKAIGDLRLTKRDGVVISTDLDPQKNNVQNRDEEGLSEEDLARKRLDSACASLSSHTELRISFGYSGLNIGTDMLNIRNDSTDNNMSFTVTPVHPDEVDKH